MAENYDALIIGTGQAGPPLAISERRQLDVEGAVWQRVLEATGQPGVMRDA